jgi:hypothetical protein
MVSDSRHGMRRASGDIVTELSPGSHADWQQALLGGVWVQPTPIVMSTTTMTFTPLSDGSVQIEGIGIDWATLGYRIGDTLKITGSVNNTYNNKIFTIFSVPLTNRVFAWPSSQFTGVGAAPLSAGTISTGGSRCQMGNIYRSFTVERAFTDIGSFITFNGIRPNQMAVDLPPTGIATATYSVIGQDANPISRASIDGLAEIVITQVGAGTLTFNGATKKITRSSGSWITDGFTVGSRVVFSGTGITDVQNRNPRTITKIDSATVITVASAIQTGGPYSGPFEILRVGLPDYTLVSDEDVLVAVSGVLLKDGTPCATITGMNFSIDNQMSGSEVVGANIIPTVLYGIQCVVSGTITVLFDRGGLGEALYNAFDLEQDDITLIMRLDTAAGDDAITFTFPRCKINTGSIGDAVAEGLPVSCDFRALKPHAAFPLAPVSQIVISDTTVPPA